MLHTPLSIKQRCFADRPSDPNKKSLPEFAALEGFKKLSSYLAQGSSILLSIMIIAMPIAPQGSDSSALTVIISAFISPKTCKSVTLLLSQTSVFVKRRFKKTEHFVLLFPILLAGTALP
jgi:hypothetical protein